MNEALKQLLCEEVIRFRNNLFENSYSVEQILKKVELFQYQGPYATLLRHKEFSISVLDEEPTDCNVEMISIPSERIHLMFPISVWMDECKDINTLRDVLTILFVNKAPDIAQIMIENMIKAGWKPKE